jgi:alpha-2-macroglobulin
MKSMSSGGSLVNRRLAVMVVLLIFVSSLLPACRVPGQTTEAGESQAVAAASEMTEEARGAEATLPPPTPQPWSPRVAQTVPAVGEEQPLAAPVKILFDQPMDAEKTEEAFSIQPEVEGSVSWPQPNLLQFTPASDLSRATEYAVSLTSDAASESGLELAEALQFEFQTVGYLEVSAVQPAPDTEEVAVDVVVTVLFNRPVVPLTAIEDQDKLPQPLVFVPPVTGQGEWLNTSIFQFVPDEGFAPATTYKARISSSLEDTTGGVLAEDYTWEFTTVMPAVVSTSPAADRIYVSTQPTIEVAFNQPMDHEAVERAFVMRDAETGTPVAGTFAWEAEGLTQSARDEYEMYDYSWDRGEGPEQVGVETMQFTPNKSLEFGVTYEASLPEETRGAMGAVGTQEDYSWSFTTIEYPEIVGTYPEDGDDAADPWGGIEVSFSSPMDPSSITGNFTIRPAITATEVFTYWWDSNTQLQLSFDTKASTDYQVTLSRDIRGRDGQKLGRDTTIRWRTRALGPQVFVYGAGQINTYLAYTPTVIYYNVRNVSEVDFALFRMPLTDFTRASGESSWEFWDNYQGSRKNLVRRWSEDVAPDLNESLIYSVNLSGVKGGSLEPGIYYLEISVPEDAVYPEALGARHLPFQQQILVVANRNLTLKTTATDSLVWATDLRSGEVAGDLPVQIIDKTGDVLAEGDTDKDGVFVGDEHEPIDPWQTVYALIGDPDRPDEDFAIASSYWSDGISPWEFDMPVENYLQPVNAYLLTDRTIYRPGQTVYFKGILREDDDAHYSLPTSENDVTVMIYDSFGNIVYEETLTINDMGTIHGELALGDEAGLGGYSIEATYQDSYFSTSFQVAEYRKPEFQVSVETDKAEYVQDDKVNVTALATYYFGGPVANAEVRYSVLSADYMFRYAGKGWWDFTDYDYSRQGEYFGSYGELVAEGTGTTDAEGRITFSVDADIAEYVSSQLLTIEATVTDINDQEVSSRTEAVVHKGLYYIGVRPARYVGQVDKRSDVELLTVDWDSEPVPNQEVQVVFNEHNWYSVRKQAEDGQYYWDSTVEDIPVFTTTVTTDKEGMGTVGFTPDKGGVYKIVTSGMDEDEHEIRSSTYMWISGRRYINWRQENNDRLDLVTDQREYEVGDTATILIPHPYQGEVEALITIERGHIYRHWVQTLETNSDQLEIPITEDMLPNVFISVVIVKGEDETNPLPSFKMGYAELPINVSEKELQIALEPDKQADDHYQPGESVTYDILVTDNEGAPVEAELALSLVDLSVLSLADQPQSIVDQFWRERGLAVSTASGLTLSAERVNLAVAPAAKGGGGGMGDEFGVVRREFPDTAYWNPVVTTDADGEASVSVKLPDNLTTWRLSAWGATAATTVGQSQVDIVSTKNLLVRPVAPRFFVVGDQVELSTVVNNNTDASLDVEVAFEAEGLNVEDDGRQQVSVPKNGSARLAWTVIVEDAEKAMLRFGAKSDDLTDAVEISLPVYRFSTPEVVATAGVLEKDGKQMETVMLPASYDPTQGELSIQLDPSLAAGMIAGLDYLEHYPYECTEQTVSRFLPNVVTYRAFKDLGLERLPGVEDDEADAETKLAGLVGVGLQRLYNQQHYDGGWGWWIVDESDPFLTGYVLLGMIEASRAGFVVEQDVMVQAVEFIQSSLVRQPKAIDEPWKANRQAFLLYVLAEAEAGDLGRTVSLFNRRDVLDTFGKAYLAMTFGLLEPDEPSRVNTLMSDITSAAIVSATGAHWEEAQVDYYAMNTDTRSTAIVLAALSRLDPDSGLAPNVVRWLMVAREDGIWETTQENAWAIIALTDWMVATKELEASYDWQVQVNQYDLGSGSVSRDNLDQEVQLQVEVAELLADQANQVIFERSAPSGADAGTGRLYYGMYLRYFKPVEEVRALNRGIIVSRQYTMADCDDEAQMCRAIDEAEVGDVIQVKLTIIAPNDLHHVVVEDPFPAGAEGVDQSLKTTSVVGQAPELTRTDRRNPWGGDYGWWWFSHTEMRDEKAVLFATYLPQGTYEYTYLIRASLPGEYRLIPTHAYEMYFPEVFGRGDGGVFTVTQ